MKEMDRCTAASEADASDEETEAESACAAVRESAAQPPSQIRARGTLRGSTIGALAVIGVVVGFAASAVSSIEEAPPAPSQAIALGNPPPLVLTAPELAPGAAQGATPGTPMPAIWE